MSTVLAVLSFLCFAFVFVRPLVQAYRFDFATGCPWALITRLPPDKRGTRFRPPSTGLFASLKLILKDLSATGTNTHPRQE